MTTHALSTEQRLVALQDENAHLAAFLDDLRRLCRSLVSVPDAKSFAELTEMLESLDRIHKTVGGWSAYVSRAEVFEAALRSVRDYAEERSHLVPMATLVADIDQVLDLHGTDPTHRVGEGSK